MQVLKRQIWRYVGENKSRRGTEYKIREILPAVKEPHYGWHLGVRYVPLVWEEGAPNDYVRTEEDFLRNFRYVRDAATYEERSIV